MSDAIIYSGPDSGGEQRILSALPRKVPAGARCPLFAKSGIPLIPRSELPKFYGTPLKPLATWRLDQDGAGSCATEATANCLMLARQQMGLPHTLLNPLTIYRLVTSSDSGSDIGEDFDAATKYGIVPMELWDRSQHSWRSDPGPQNQQAALDFVLDETWDITTREELETAIALRFPVAFGVWWSGGGGHAITAIGMDASRVYYLGSWGPTAHEAGDGTGWLPWSQVVQGLSTFTARCVRSVKFAIPEGL